MRKLIFWEMNEINFDYLVYYIKQGHLPNWQKFINKHGLFTTTSEQKYQQLEPWIQWPTVRTGLTYQQHKVFRLGDFDHKLQQHWEILEDKGYSVAAISPINGVNNSKNSPFWIPDPWVDTKISGSPFSHKMAKAIKQAVNDNAQESLTISTIMTLINALLSKSNLSSLPQYLTAIWGAVKKQHWSKAVFLDRLLADVFIYLWRRHQPDFAVLFLNSGAHIQHHYMSNSSAYTGQNKNPNWYIKTNKDPLLEILKLYDSILQDFCALPNTRLMIATGLQQVPYAKPSFYWRLKNHSDFLQKLGIQHKKVQPRMTRDFLIEFDNISQLQKAQSILSQVKSANGEAIFQIDNRADDLFITLIYADDIPPKFSIFINAKPYANFKQDVVFVAIKNAHHHHQGYYLDSEKKPDELTQNIPLTNLFEFVMAHFAGNKKSQ